jgi:hypothetical protein
MSEIDLDAHCRVFVLSVAALDPASAGHVRDAITRAQGLRRLLVIGRAGTADKNAAAGRLYYVRATYAELDSDAADDAFSVRSFNLLGGAQTRRVGSAAVSHNTHKAKLASIWTRTKEIRRWADVWEHGSVWNMWPALHYCNARSCRSINL